MGSCDGSHQKKADATAIINDEVSNEKEVVAETTTPEPPNGAPLYNKVTKGLHNPFAGTSWGND